MLDDDYSCMRGGYVPEIGSRLPRIMKVFSVVAHEDALNRGGWSYLVLIACIRQSNVACCYDIVTGATQQP